MSFTPLNGPPDDDQQLCERCYKPITNADEMIVVYNKKGDTSSYCSELCKVIHRDQGVTKTELWDLLYHHED